MSPGREPGRNAFGRRDYSHRRNHPPGTNTISMSAQSSETFGVLLAIGEAGTASVVSICTASEAQDMADDDFSRRDPDRDICPEAYEFHARDASGKYVLFATITP